MVFWKMSLLHWLTKLTHQINREKISGKVSWRQWRHGDWTLKPVSEIAFCFILTAGFVLIVIRTWFTEMILLPIISVPIFITIIAVPVFMPFFLLLSPWLCWCSSCHYYWSWFDCRCYCCHFCSIVVINTSLFCSIWHLLCIIMFSVLSRLFLCHCCFCCFVVAVFSLSLLMLLLLHVVFCCCCCCCCMGVVVFIVIGVMVVVGVVVLVLVVLFYQCCIIALSFFMIFWFH